MGRFYAGVYCHWQTREGWFYDRVIIHADSTQLIANRGLIDTVPVGDLLGVGLFGATGTKG